MRKACLEMRPKLHQMAGELDSKSEAMSAPRL